MMRHEEPDRSTTSIIEFCQFAGDAKAKSNLANIHITVKRQRGPLIALMLVIEPGSAC